MCLCVRVGCCPVVWRRERHEIVGERRVKCAVSRESQRESQSPIKRVADSAPSLVPVILTVRVIMLSAAGQPCSRQHLSIFYGAHIYFAAFCVRHGRWEEGVLTANRTLTVSVAYLAS